MAAQQKQIITSRLGEREVMIDKVIHFPHGLIGFEGHRDFTLLAIREGAPLLVLQSMSDPGLGLLVADPYSFIPEYTVRMSDAEQRLLKAESARDIAVLVTASIPPGRPDQTALNLTGPILVNHRARLGLQVPQPERGAPGKLYVHVCEAQEP